MSNTQESPEQDRFNQWLNGVSPQARHQVKGSAELVVEQEDHSAFHQFRDELDPVAQQAARDEADTKTVWPQGRKPKFCLAMQKDGEWQTLKIFGDLDTLVARLRELEGTDTGAIPFLGIPLPVTKGPDRLLMLPDNTAVRIRDGKKIDEIQDEVVLQDDWFFGPPELAIVTSRPDDDDEETKTKKKGKIPKPPEDDEEDDEEEDEEDGE